MFGNPEDLVNSLCDGLSADPQLQNGFIGIGISQGGLWLRGFLQKCNNPPMKKLVTLGTPHQGIDQVPYGVCKLFSWFCRIGSSFLLNFVYSSFALNNVLSAHFFKHPTKYNDSLDIYINRINSSPNPLYKNTLSSLEQLILVLFERDIVINPVESCHFGFRDSQLAEDFVEYNSLGLSELDAAGKLHRLSMDAGHTRVSEEFLRYQLMPLLFPDQDLVENPEDGPITFTSSPFDSDHSSGWTDEGRDLLDVSVPEFSEPSQEGSDDGSSEGNAQEDNPNNHLLFDPSDASSDGIRFPQTYQAWRTVRKLHRKEHRMLVPN